MRVVRFRAGFGMLGVLFGPLFARYFGPFYKSPGPKPGGFGTLIAKKASFTVSREGFSSHEGEPGDPKNGPNLRTRRDSVSADREAGLFGRKGAKLPWFWGPGDLENGPKFLSDCRQRP